MAPSEPDLVTRVGRGEIDVGLTPHLAVGIPLQLQPSNPQRVLAGNQVVVWRPGDLEHDV
jgi:hypothetical protein